MIKANILDEKDKVFKNDPSSMLSCIEELPDQIKDCWQKSKKIIIPAHYLKIKNIVILGMGGSAIGGDLAKSVVFRHSKVPISVLRDYEIPNFVDNNTLVIASSYSGNTEETISALEKSIKSNAKIIVITSGGTIERMSKKYNFPCYKIVYESQPRAAIGYSLTSIIAIMSKIGIIQIDDCQIEKIIYELREIYEKVNLTVPIKKNLAKELAIKMHDHFVLIIGSGILTNVAVRYKTQINENAKQMAIYDSLPEMNHNTIVGLDFPDKINHKLFVLLIQSSYDHKRTKLRQQILIKLLTKKKIKFDTLMLAPSINELSEIFKMIYLGDYISYYMSVLNQVDPTPVEAIVYLKDKLSKL